MGQENLHAIFRHNQPGLKKVLGDLEAEIMEAVWAAAGPVSAKDIHPVLPTGGKLSYTTVVCTMTSLAKKGMLHLVNRQGRAHIYRAVLAREEFLHRALGQVLDNIFADFPDTAATLIARRGQEGRPSPAEDRTLDELGEHLERLKREEEP